MLIQPPRQESKIGQKNRGNRQKLNPLTVSKTPTFRIWCLVGFIHLVLIAWIALPPFRAYTPAKGQVTIHTHVETAKPNPPTQPSSAKKQTAPPKKAASPPVKKEVAKKAPTPEKSIAPETSDLLNSLAKTLDQLLDATPEPAKLPALFVPSLLPSQGAHASPPPRYAQAVMQLLTESLELPEFGEVIATLEINASGRVTHVEIIQTQNPKNSDFLKKRLLELPFPCFNEFALSETRLQFTIAFRNAENL